MKRLSVPAALALALLFTAACEPYNPRPPKKEPGGFHPPKPRPSAQMSSETEVTTSSETVESTPPPPPSPTGPIAPVEPTRPVGELPYAKAVPGKPGFVSSPYDPYKGYIDVRGFPPGTEVKDPYSGKTFLVPPF
jgi:hypothetical protein